jgi:hypothetical protein
MKHVSPQAFLEGIEIPGIAAKLAPAFENTSAPIVIDPAEIVAAALIVTRAKRGSK